MIHLWLKHILKKVYTSCKLYNEIAREVLQTDCIYPSISIAII